MDVLFLVLLLVSSLMCCTNPRNMQHINRFKKEI